jgi:hypothetical protein
MTILHAYTSTYNDLWMIQRYVQHWRQYADRIFVYDDDSTDGTSEYLDSQAPLVVRMSPGFHGIDEILLQEMRCREYKLHSRGVADWCVIGDSDEFHYHPEMLKRLDELKSKDAIAVVSHGFQMFSDTRPDDGVLLTDYIKTGIADHMYDRVIFRPEIDITIGVGHHGFTIDNVNYREFQRAGQTIHTSDEKLQGQHRVIQNEYQFKMLHYKYIARDHVVERHNRTWSRCSDRNKERGWGVHTSPEWHSYYSVDWYDKMLKEAKPCFD